MNQTYRQAVRYIGSANRTLVALADNPRSSLVICNSSLPHCLTRNEWYPLVSVLVGQLAIAENVGAHLSSSLGLFTLINHDSKCQENAICSEFSYSISLAHADRQASDLDAVCLAFVIGRL